MWWEGRGGGKQPQFFLAALCVHILKTINSKSLPADFIIDLLNVGW